MSVTLTISNYNLFYSIADFHPLNASYINNTAISRVDMHCLASSNNLGVHVCECANVRGSIKIIRPPNFNDNIIHSLLNQRFQFSIGNLDVVLRHPAILCVCVCEREREKERESLLELKRIFEIILYSIKNHH